MVLKTGPNRPWADHASNLVRSINPERGWTWIGPAEPNEPNGSHRTRQFNYPPPLQQPLWELPLLSARSCHWNTPTPPSCNAVKPSPATPTVNPAPWPPTDTDCKSLSPPPRMLKVKQSTPTPSSCCSLQHPPPPLLCC